MEKFAKVKGAMEVKTASVAIYELDSAQDMRGTKDLVDALSDVAKARSTKDLMRMSQQRQVNCALRVPLLKGRHPVRSNELGRTLRKLIRSAVDAASPGDHVLVDFLVTSDPCLEIRAGPANEMGGFDSSTIDGLFAH